MRNTSTKYVISAPQQKLQEKYFWAPIFSTCAPFLQDTVQQNRYLLNIPANLSILDALHFAGSNSVILVPNKETDDGLH